MEQIRESYKAMDVPKAPAFILFSVTSIGCLCPTLQRSKGGFNHAACRK